MTSFTLAELGESAPEETLDPQEQQQQQVQQEEQEPEVKARGFTLEELGTESGEGFSVQGQGAIMSPYAARAQGRTLTPEEQEAWDEATGAGLTPEGQQVEEQGQPSQGAEEPTTGGQQKTEEEEENLLDTISQGADFLAEDVSAFWNRANHIITLAGEKSVVSSAQLVDFVRKVNNWKNFGGKFELPDISVNGLDINSQSFEEVSKDLLITAKKAVGGGDELESINNVADRFVALGAENFGPSALIGGTLKVGKKLAKVPDSIRSFLRTEGGLTILGATVGTTGGEFFGDTEEEKENLSQIFNLSGMLTIPLIKDIANFSMGVNIIKRVFKKEPLYDHGKANELSRKEVNKFVTALVPEELVPDVMQRWEMSKEIQKLDKDFLPSVGNLIGTPEAVATQRAVDSRNPELAISNYLKTKAAVARLVERSQAGISPTDRIKVAVALRLFAQDTQAFLDTTAARMISLEDELRAVGTPGFSATKNGDALRAELKTVQDLYRETRETLFSQVDPGKTAKFDPRLLMESLDELLEGGDPLKQVLEGQEGFTYLTKELPKIFAGMAQRSVEQGTEGLNTALGFSSKPKPFLSYLDLKAIYEELGSQATAIASKDPTSKAPGVLKGFRRDVRDMLDSQMMSGDPGVAERYAKARAFMSEEYYTRFKEGVGGALNKRKTASEEFSIRLDKVGAEFWQPGQDRANLEDFEKIFSSNPNVTNPQVIEASREIAETALQEHALQTLDDMLDKNPGAEPLKILARWKATYKGALDSFPSVGPRVDELEVKFQGLASQKAAHAQKEVDLNKSIISKYSDQDPDTLSKTLIDATPTQAEAMLGDILRATARQVDNPDYMSKYPAILEPSLKSGTHLSNAIRQNVIGQVIDDAFDPALDGPSWISLNKILHDKGATLSRILQPEDMTNLEKMRDVLKLMGNSPVPQTQIELDKFKSVLQGIGISPASVLSRYYSASLGKVGPVYLITDAATRLVTTVSSKHFDKVFRETMYDIDALENVLKARGADEALQEVVAFKDVLRTAGFKTVQGLVEGHFALRGYRVGNLIEEKREKKEREERERLEGKKVPKDPNDDINLIEEVLIHEDDLTGQPSRIAPQVFGMGIDEEITKAAKEIEDGREFFNKMDRDDDEIIAAELTGKPLPQEPAQGEPIDPQSAEIAEKEKRIDELSSNLDNLGEGEVKELATLMLEARGRPQALRDVGFRSEGLPSDIADPADLEQEAADRAVQIGTPVIEDTLPEGPGSDTPVEEGEEGEEDLIRADEVGQGPDVGSITAETPSDRNKVWSNVFNAADSLGLERSTAQALADTAAVGFDFSPSADADAVVTGVHQLAEGQTTEGALNLASGLIPVAGDFGKALFLGIRSTRGQDSALFRAVTETVKGGKAAEQIRKETGWFQGKEGAWRFEIDDTKAQYVGNLVPSPTDKSKQMLDLPRQSDIKLDDVIQHDELFNQYPHLKDIEVRRTGMFSFGLQGAYDAEKKVLFLNPNLSVDEATSTALHEIQHAIQDFEGFLPGGNSGQFLPEGFKAARKEINNASRKFFKKFPDVNQFALGDAIFDLKRGRLPRNPLAKEALETLNAEDSLQEAVDLLEAVSLMRTLEADAFTSYQRLAGEVESRNVQTRLEMLKDGVPFKDLPPPKETQLIDDGVPFEDQIAPPSKPPSDDLLPEVPDV